MISLSFFVGNLLIIISGPLVGVYGFAGNTLVVTAGLLSFISGYEILQEQSNEILSYLETMRERKMMFHTFLALIGIVLVTKGFVIGAQATSNPNLYDMFFCGLFILSGQVTSHVGVNKTLL